MHTKLTRIEIIDLEPSVFRDVHIIFCTDDSSTLPRYRYLPELQLRSQISRVCFTSPEGILAGPSITSTAMDMETETTERCRSISSLPSSEGGTIEYVHDLGD